MNLSNSSNEKINLNYIINKILLINYDEKHLKFNIDNVYFSKKIISAINIIKPAIIIVCTQNSLSGTNKHFQHYLSLLLIGGYTNYLKKKIEKNKRISNDYHLLSKIDAVREINSRFFYKNPYNIKTRIYIDLKQIYLNLNINKISKYSTFSPTNNNYLDSYNSNKNEYTKSEQYNTKIIISSYKFKRETSKTKGKEGVGKIMINLLLTYKETNFNLIIYNIHNNNNNIGIESNFLTLYPFARYEVNINNVKIIRMSSNVIPIKIIDLNNKINTKINTNINELILNNKNVFDFTKLYDDINKYLINKNKDMKNKENLLTNRTNLIIFVKKLINFKEKYYDKLQNISSRFNIDNFIELTEKLIDEYDKILNIKY